MNFLFYYSLPTVFQSLYYKLPEDREYAFHFIAFVVVCHMCYSTSARAYHSKVEEIVNYFQSRLADLYDLNMCTINMHLLLHLPDQVRLYGAMPFCSMFSFEHQFFSYKVLTQGNKSLLDQISNKVTLLKFCKLYLELSDYREKERIKKLLSLDSDDVHKFVLMNRGLVKRGQLNFYASCYRRLGKFCSTVVELHHNGESVFVDVCHFYKKGREIFARVKMLTSYNIPMLNFSRMTLPTVPRTIAKIVEDHSYFFGVKATDVYEDVSVKDFLHSCVLIKDFDPNLHDSGMIVIPCVNVPEYC